MISDLTHKDTQTPTQRMAALIAGTPQDRVPFMPFASGFAARMAGMDLGTFYRYPEKAFEAGLALMQRFSWMNSRPSYGWAERGAWEFGGQIVWPDNNRYPAPLSHQPVITQPEQVPTLADPDPTTAGMFPLVERFNALARSRGLTASLPGGTPTTMTAGILGRDTFLKWIVRYPEAIHALQRKVTDLLIRAALNTINTHGAGNCSLFCGVPMESNQLISAQMFETFCKPYICELLDLYSQEGVQSVTVHLCGDHTQNLAHWKDMALPPRTIFSIGHEMDLAVTAAFIGDRHIIAGNLNNAIVQNGTTEQVYAETVRALEVGMAHPGGFLLMPACEFPPFTPLENVAAIGHAIADKGFYEHGRSCGALHEN